MVKINYLLKAIQDVIDKENYSGTVFIKLGEEVILEKAAGFANKSEERPNELNTRFGIASGCKIFTSTAICQLVEKGLLGFNTKLIDCLDISFVNWDEKVTIHQLLTHSSGIPDYFDEEVMNDFEELWKETPMYLLRRPSDFLPLFQHQPMKSEPGKVFHYNNAGYILLGLVVERLTEMPFTDYVAENIFKPAGMQSSGYYPMDELPQNTAFGYVEKSGGQYKTNVYSLPVKGGPDGGAYVTAGDMIRFWEALFENRILDEKLTRVLLSPRIKVKEGVHYGYGVWINNEEAVTKYHVMGYDPGVSFHSGYFPEVDMRYAIPCNHSSGAFSIMKKIDEYIGSISGR
ncbi:serine hydrolase [Rossellomorea vietnamensis]|uniref:Serine hydrolase n=1 Tax=Rossellomorea vietnamensis TaxID=218284 RepID=A0A5D4P1K3_9BACI|nr:serine hydrolase [Rossellomorea vietnamensis]TYS18662.1 serine hydrolase [Rossellomorea vietnamensis]